MFKGSITALVTPFAGNSVDIDSFEKIVEWQIAQGTHGLVPCGTTGESPTLSHEEHDLVIETCIAVANKRVPVIAGTGSNNTREAIRLTQNAEKVGADAALVVTPYYNKPGQKAMLAHYRAIAESTSLPIVIYNIPGRSVVDMSIETMAELATIKNIIGVKDATADLSRPLNTRVAIGDAFCQLSGEDATVTAFLAQGGHGCISVSSNVAPALCAQLHNAWQAGDLATCFAIRDKLAPLHDALFVEANPGPAKYAMSLLGLCQADVRLPLVDLQDRTKDTVKAAMIAAGILEK
jgi:4-hydroxy-tetrahydrodipicolinate synthase